MNKKKNTVLKGTLLLAAAVLFLRCLKLLSEKRPAGGSKRQAIPLLVSSGNIWRSLVPHYQLLHLPGNPRMRKEPNVPFGREAFVLEQHLDKLGANGGS